MIGLVQTSWLFTRGSQSVRIIRVSQPKASVRLLVNGPGSESLVHEMDDAIECARHQSEIERRLVAQGYQLAHFLSVERRTGRDRRGVPRGSDRRNHLERAV
jgi:hypothetical protein